MTASPGPPLRSALHPPLRIAEFDEYLAVLRPLLRGEEVDFDWRGRSAPLVHLMPDEIDLIARLAAVYVIGIIFAYQTCRRVWPRNVRTG